MKGDMDENYAFCSQVREEQLWMEVESDNLHSTQPQA